ncbi:hypothetical protein E2C01_088210 [Portunus trituberculatus]|uniref:Uncharacterized protein n=1 Tax=Portunus trituberculatus TaxID=210409 RepID=A0A5B7JA55_PORTR|nr:hypothetical protein [Portunus trituberculatus]
MVEVVVYRSNVLLFLNTGSATAATATAITTATHPNIITASRYHTTLHTASIISLRPAATAAPPPH